MKHNAPKRRRNPTPLGRPHHPVPGSDSEICEQCRLSGRRIRFSVSLAEAEDIIIALRATDQTVLANYFQAHLTIAERPESYQYDC